MHAEQYVHLVNPKSYALLTCLERFQFFLEDNSKSETGIAYYEEFTNSARRKITKEMDELRSIVNFYPTLERIKGKVGNGKPTKDVILQFADFFVYSPHIKFVTQHEKQNRWNEIRHKYYNGDDGNDLCC